MRALVQRVKDCSVYSVHNNINEQLIAQLDYGLLVYLGIHTDDTRDSCVYIARKICGVRVFPDEQGVMNNSVIASGGGICVVSQFTLYGSVRRGMRPSYSTAMQPVYAEQIYDYFLLHMYEQYSVPLVYGQFQAHMNVYYCNDGPVSILIES